MLNLWNERIPRIEDERRYEFLIQLHQLTHHWIEGISQEPEAHQLKRFVPPEFDQNLWLLEKLRLDTLPPNLSSIVESTSVTEFLDQLEDTIWTVQSSILVSALSNPDASSILNRLEQISWTFGKQLSELEERLPFTKLSIEQLMSELSPNMFSFKSPLIDLSMNAHHFSLKFIWKDHPGSRPILSRSSALEQIIELHQHGFSGWIYGISPKLKTQFEHATLKNLQKNLQAPIQVEVSTLDLNRL